MEREDPLERIEREEREKRSRGASGGSLRTTMWALAAIAAVLAVVLAVVWIQKSSLVSDLKEEKQELTTQIETLQKDYETLSSDYDSINLQLDSSREEISQLVERIKKTDATNRAKIRQYQKELGTLRSIMRGYIVQIDSLNDLNHKLTAQAARARKEAAESRRQNEKLTTQVETLSSQVAAGSIIKARGIRLEAFGSNDRTTDRSKNVVRMMVTLSLIENEIAEKGPVRIYVRLTSPEGVLLRDGSGASFTLGSEVLEASASREVDYEGSDVELSIYINDIPSFSKGVYVAEAYTSQSRLGSAEVLLR